MSTLHERLLARIAELGQHLTGCTSCSTCEAAALGHTVRGTVELHRPVTLDGITFCPTCRPGGGPSCVTALAIAEALGVQIGETP